MAIDVLDETVIDKTLPKLDEAEFPDNARRMMRAGIHLFAQKGFAGTSVREIVQAADVTNPMLYYYFDNKEGLYNTLITYLFEDITREVNEQVEEVESLVEAVDTIILAYFESCRRSPVALRFIYMVLFGPEDASPEVDLFETRREMVGEVANVFDRAIEQGQFEPTEDFDSLYMTELLLGLISQRLMQKLKRVEAHPDRPSRRQAMRELTSREHARKLRQFFFFGAGTLTDQ